jgi:uridine kinase
MLKPFIISIDNYYRNAGDDSTPLDDEGMTDLEHIDALDIEKFNEDLNALMDGKTVQMPIYDFSQSRRIQGETVKLEKGQPILIEGIHALNPRMSQLIEDAYKYKVYVTALTCLNLDEHNRIPSHNVRLLRRLVRDHYFRGTPLNETFMRWGSVRRGEEKWVFPFQEEADFIFNSALSYEIAVLKKYLHPLLFTITRQMEGYAQSRELIKFLNYFLTCSEEDIQSLSILREFIGDCGFYKK